MKKEIADQNQSETFLTRYSPFNLWRRFWKAYEYKKRTDQSFFATMVAIQVLLVVVFFLTVGLVIAKKSNVGSANASFFSKSL